MDFRHVVFVNPYLTDQMPQDVMNKIYAKHFEFGNTPARATIKVASLPQGANIEFTGVAVRDLSKRVAVRPKNMAPSADRESLRVRGRHVLLLGKIRIHSWTE